MNISVMKMIPNYSKYAVTPDGRVWNSGLRKGWMAPTVDRNGYVRFHLISDDGKRRGVYAHQLVAQLYIPNPESKPFVNHKDFNKGNNSVENLEWCTHTENIQHDWKSGRRSGHLGESNGQSRVTEAIVREIRKQHKLGVKQTMLSKIFGISQATVSQIVLHKTWRQA